MKSYSQTFTGAQTWTLNVPGSYFTVLGCTNAVNVRLYKGGQLLPLGEITGILAGLEVGPIDAGPGGFAFDQVRIDATAADTITIGIGNGQAHYNRSNGNVAVTSLVPTRFTGANTAVTVTNASSQILAANGSRTYLLIQNKDAAGSIYIVFGAAATVALGVLIPPGGAIEFNCNVPTAAVYAIGDIASNGNVVMVTG